MPIPWSLAWGGVRCAGSPTVRRAAADLVLAGVDCDKAVVCTLRHDERLRSGGTAYIQAALLYTTPGGQRRVRVHTLALPIASSLGSVFRGADLDATLQVCTPVLPTPTRGQGLCSLRAGHVPCRIGTTHAPVPSSSTLERG